MPDVGAEAIGRRQEQVRIGFGVFDLIPCDDGYRGWIDAEHVQI